MNKLGIFTNFWEKNWNVDHRKYIEKAAKIGFDILEFQAQPLLEMSRSEMAEIRNFAVDKGVELTYSLGLDKKYDLSSDSAAVQRAGIDYLRRIVECIGFMKGTALSGVAYEGWGAPAEIIESKEGRLERSVKCMKQVIQTAQEYGVTYSVEAVNRFECCLINTAEEAIDYVNRVDSRNIGVLLDTYHMNIEENNIGDAVRLAGSKLTAFHTGDNNRRCPGRGHIDFDEVFCALSEIGYPHRIVSEPFVMMGGEVGRDIKVWRDLDTPDEDALDQEAGALLQFEKQLLQKYHMA